jgi:hypothetical protein
MRDHKQKTTLGKSIPAKSNLKTFMGKPFGWVINHVLFIQSIFSLGIALSLSFVWIFSGSAQGSAAYIREVRVMEADKTGLQNPAGLAFSSRANAFTVVEQPGQNPPAATDIGSVQPRSRRRSKTRSTWRSIIKSIVCLSCNSQPINCWRKGKSRMAALIQQR